MSGSSSSSPVDVSPVGLIYVDEEMIRQRDLAYAQNHYNYINDPAVLFRQRDALLEPDCSIVVEQDHILQEITKEQEEKEEAIRNKEPLPPVGRKCEVEYYATKNGQSFAATLESDARPFAFTEDHHITDESLYWPFCYLCDNAFKNWKGFEYHVLVTHLSYKPFSCDRCSKVQFATEWDCIHHSALHHPDDEGPTAYTVTYNVEKEKKCDIIFSNLFVVVKRFLSDNTEISKERIAKFRQIAFKDAHRLDRLRFKNVQVVVIRPLMVRHVVQTPSSYTTLKDVTNTCTGEEKKVREIVIEDDEEVDEQGRQELSIIIDDDQELMLRASGYLDPPGTPPTDSDGQSSTGPFLFNAVPVSPIHYGRTRRNGVEVVEEGEEEEEVEEEVLAAEYEEIELEQ